jgi:hypothetical protein
MKGEVIMRMVVYVLALMTLAGCGATVHSTLVKRDAHLGDFKKIHLSIATAGGAVSVTGAGMGSGSASVTGTPSGISGTGVGSSLSVTHAMSGNDQVIMAAQDIAFALDEMGFDTVEKVEDADMVALFSIGTVRYDPLAGWIADRAFLQFKDQRSGKTVLSIKADGQLITPTVGTIVQNLIAEVRRYY